MLVIIAGEADLDKSSCGFIYICSRNRTENSWNLNAATLSDNIKDFRHLFKNAFIFFVTTVFMFFFIFIIYNGRQINKTTVINVNYRLVFSKKNKDDFRKILFR